MAQNSQIRAKGVGKDSKRHDLDGTPGLSAGSSVNYGETAQLEAGQAAIQNTQAGQAAGGGAGGAGAAGVQIPDPIAFAGEKVGGETGQLPQGQTTPVDTAEFLPLLKALAVGNSSSAMKMAYMEYVSNIARRPWSGGSTALINRQELDKAVEQAF